MKRFSLKIGPISVPEVTKECIIECIINLIVLINMYIVRTYMWKR